MARQTLLTPMLQGSYATSLTPESAKSHLIIPNEFPLHITGNYQPNMKILAIGIDDFGACTTRLLVDTNQNVCCCELTSHAQLHQEHVLCELSKAIQQSNLLFLLTDGTQSSSAPILTDCLEAAETVGIQVIVISPNAILHQPPYHVCTVPDPLTACNLIRMVADLAKIDDINFNYDDHVKPVLQSGRNRHFASYQAAGAERGSVAGRGVLAQLQQQIPEEQDYSGALACIYCNAKTYHYDFDQVIAELFCFFLPNSTNKFNIIYNCVIDENLVDEVRVAVLAIT